MELALYDRIRSDLETEIVSGAWPPGTRVPTEAELARTYGVSRVTVQRAVQELVQRGLVVRYRRRGTFVARAAPERNLLRLAGPLSTGPEIEGRHVVSEARVIPARDAAADLEGIEPDTPVVQLRRVKLDVAERPIATELAVIPFALVPRLLDEPLEDLTTIGYFRRTGVPVHSSRMYVEPRLLSEEEAALLDRPPGIPVFRLRRHIRLADGRPAEVFESTLLPDHSPFYIEQSLVESPPDPD
ncbi:DNA-binding GntR family transcriptional regulator [Spinactinospora alkalitolerans]|uniref:DNA-binding GntR family transcriptional regulator n=1 Tax=Spinactinospora alkalitolerans TaxID=687207 RepID=A0A852TWH8_9ACTN|nr:GntR family transcriptional regulator [Spinactinospora alkalitolerans]NYE47745.1 DNA-binding GntR family transcriptional regulator [Spinactinospora alkalitolerans]